MWKFQTLASLLLTVTGLEIGFWTRTSIAQLATTDEQQDSPKSVQAPEFKPNTIFKEIDPLLLRKTRVPLRLPEYVPYNGDKENPLYAILEVAQPNAYSIQLAWVKDCEGGNACHVGNIGGSKTRLNPAIILKFL